MKEVGTYPAVRKVCRGHRDIRHKGFPRRTRLRRIGDGRESLLALHPVADLDT